MSLAVFNAFSTILVGLSMVVFSLLVFAVVLHDD